MSAEDRFHKAFQGISDSWSVSDVRKMVEGQQLNVYAGWEVRRHKLLSAGSQGS